MDKEVYQDSEAVVGPNHISDAPFISPPSYSTNSGAVPPPANTAEVQAVVRLCNRHRVSFGPVSSGWGGMYPEGTVLLDLRRMDHIIEINEENMYAVVEPYVINAELQAELMKRGLNCNIKGAGSNGSAMLKGHGHMDQTCGGDDRNYLAVEWVTPEGELIRLGSLGAANEWFCGDRPGPSLRAVISGSVPPGLTPGIMTTAAQKVYPWPGPARFPVTGLSPEYTLSEIPPNMLVRYFSFPSAENLYEAERRIGEAEISYELMAFNMAMVCANISSSNEEDMATFERLRRLVRGPGFLLLILASTPEEFAYDQLVLNDILEKTGGTSLAPVEDPKIGGKLLCQCIRVSASIRETFRVGSTGWGGFAVMGQRDLTMRWLAEAGRRKADAIEKGLAMDDGAANFGGFGWGVEQGHLGKSERFYRPTSAEGAAEAAAEWRRQTNLLALEGSYAVPMGLPPDIVGPKISNYLEWQDRISRLFDPNGVIPAPVRRG